MSGTTTPPAESAADSLMNPMFIITMTLLAIAAGTIAAVFLGSDTAVKNVVAGTVVGGIIGSITGFYFGSSKGSQAKDATIAAQAAVPPSNAGVSP